MSWVPREDRPSCPFKGPFSDSGVDHGNFARCWRADFGRSRAVNWVFRVDRPCCTFKGPFSDSGVDRGNLARCGSRVSRCRMCLDLLQRGRWLGTAHLTEDPGESPAAFPAEPKENQHHGLIWSVTRGLRGSGRTEVMHRPPHRQWNATGRATAASDADGIGRRSDRVGRRSIGGARTRQDISADEGGVQMPESRLAVDGESRLSIGLSLPKTK